METGARLIGTVKSFTDHWGFVRTDEGKDYFFNERSALNGRQKKENTEEKRERTRETAVRRVSSNPNVRRSARGCIDQSLCRSVLFQKRIAMV